jgi:hypothetical protein
MYLMPQCPRLFMASVRNFKGTSKRSAFPYDNCQELSRYEPLRSVSIAVIDLQGCLKCFRSAGPPAQELLYASKIAKSNRLYVSVPRPPGRHNCFERVCTGFLQPTAKDLG